jgi:hypothetical protein
MLGDFVVDVARARRSVNWWRHRGSDTEASAFIVSPVGLANAAKRWPARSAIGHIRSVVDHVTYAGDGSLVAAWSRMVVVIGMTGDRSASRNRRLRSRAVSGGPNEHWLLGGVAAFGFDSFGDGSGGFVVQFLGDALVGVAG